MFTYRYTFKTAQRKCEKSEANISLKIPPLPQTPTNKIHFNTISSKLMFCPEFIESFISTWKIQSNENSRWNADLHFCIELQEYNLKPSEAFIVSTAYISLFYWIRRHRKSKFSQTSQVLIKINYCAGQLLTCLISNKRLQVEPFVQNSTISTWSLLNTNHSSCVKTGVGTWGGTLSATARILQRLSIPNCWTLYKV